jgi:hypothetical protein
MRARHSLIQICVVVLAWSLTAADPVTGQPPKGTDEPDGRLTDESAAEARKDPALDSHPTHTTRGTGQ